MDGKFTKINSLTIKILVEEFVLVFKSRIISPRRKTFYFEEILGLTDILE